MEICVAVRVQPRQLALALPVADRAEDDERQGAQVCLIGQTVKSALFLDANPIGQELRVHDIACRVVGYEYMDTKFRLSNSS